MVNLFSIFNDGSEFERPEDVRAELDYTDAQVAGLRKRLIAAATNKLTISPETDETKTAEAFVRSHEYFRGAIETLQLLLIEIENYRNSNVETSSLPSD